MQKGSENWLVCILLQILSIVFEVLNREGKIPSGSRKANVQLHFKLKGQLEK